MKMVVSPKSLIETITEEDQKEMAALEAHIDATLLKFRYLDSTGQAWVGFNGIREPRRYAMEKVLDKYRAQDWAVSYIPGEVYGADCDQYQAPYLSFSYKRKGDGK